MRLAELPKDIIIAIANFNEDAWRKLYQTDKRIRKYTMTKEGLTNIVKLATKRTIFSDRIEYTLFGKLHRYPYPAIIYKDGNIAWYQNDEFECMGCESAEDGNEVAYLNSPEHKAKFVS